MAQVKEVFTTEEEEDKEGEEPTDPEEGKEESDDPPEIVKEREEERDAHTKVFELEDGRMQKEVSATPVHYENEKGEWEEIQLGVEASDESKFVLSNESNTFQTHFGKTADQLVRFEQGDHRIEMKALEASDVVPEGKEHQVVFKQLWQQTDLLYDIGPDSLKETIRMNSVPTNPVYTFEFTLTGLYAEQKEDGAIAFFSKKDDTLVYMIPKPFMMDSKEDPESPYGFSYSENVTQTMEADGDTLTVTLAADEEWLQAEERVYPVLLDPTIVLSPPEKESQDTYINSGNPDQNYDNTWQMKVGTSSGGSKYRGLVRFNLDTIPEGERLDQATLSLYYDQDIYLPEGGDTYSVPITVHKVKEAWDPDSVTWKYAGEGDNWKDGGAYDATALDQETKQVGHTNRWHRFNVTSTVQSWLNKSSKNYGFLLKAKTESNNHGGTVYVTSELYDPTIPVRPKLTLIYGQPSVTVKEPQKIHSTGAELEWSKFADGEEFVEYQVHRSTDQQFVPDASTLVTPIDDRFDIRFTDTTVEPTPIEDENRVGQIYYYMVAVKTKDGKLHPSSTVMAQLPKAGLTRVLVRGAEDTTLSSKKSSTNLNDIERYPWLQVGIKGNEYGTTRSVFDFDLSMIPEDAQVFDAQFQVWAWYMWRPQGVTGKAKYRLHELTHRFDESSATWKIAANGDNWTDGGQYDSTVLDEISEISNDSRWRTFDVTGVVGDWVTGKKKEYGFILKQADEGSEKNSERTLFLNSEAQETSLRPTLEVIYTTPTTESTYHTTDTPQVMEGGETYDIDITLTNTTDRIWKQGEQSVAYRWADLQTPQGTDRVNLPKDVKPGETIRLKAEVHAPQLKGKGAYRESRMIEWDLIDHNGKWLSEHAQGIPALQQAIVVESKPDAKKLGFEPDRGLITEPTGAGTALTANLFEGNTMFDYTPFANPSRGFATAPQMTYNSRDFSDSLVGPGWSFALTNMMRLGTPSNSKGVKMVNGKIESGKVFMIDGDGTQYSFTYDKGKKKFVGPKGIHLSLKLHSTKDKARMWKITAKDGSKYYFDDKGYVSETTDRNGIKMTYTYESRRIGNHNVKLLRYLTDTEGRRTIKVEYYSSKETSNLKIQQQVKRLTDISGYKVEFAYDHEGRLTQITEGAGSKEERKYQLSYEFNLLRTITDPKGNTTKAYYDDGGHLTKIIDRQGEETTIHYRTTLDDKEQPVTLVTDPMGRQMATTFNDQGKPIEVVNANNEKTRYEWDDELNLVKQIAPNDATATWTYDDNGNVLTYKSPLYHQQQQAQQQAAEEANVLEKLWDKVTGAVEKAPLVGTAGTTGKGYTQYAYDYREEGQVADLVQSVSPEGRVTTYEYNDEGHLLKVHAPQGNTLSSYDDAKKRYRVETSGNYTTTYTYHKGGLGLLESVKDAKGRVSRYTDYDANGQPQTITDPAGNVTRLHYGKRGEVLQVTDALGNTSTYTYDTFLRPLTSKVPKDASAGEYITIPAPVYDENDNIVKAVSPNGAHVTYTYNKNDWVTSATLPKDSEKGPIRKITYQYDKMGNLIRETQPKGNHQEGVITLDNRDDAHIASGIWGTSTNMPGYRGEDYQYNRVGGGDTFTWNFQLPEDGEYRVSVNYAQARDRAIDAPYTLKTKDGDVTKRVDQTTNGGTWVDLGIHPFASGANQIVQSDDASEGTYVIADAIRIEKVNEGEEKKETADGSTQYIYDRLNRVQAVVNSQGHRVTYEYDQVGNVTQVTEPKGVASDDPDDYRTTYEYDVNGRAIKETDALGNSIAFAYSPDGLLTRVTDEEGNVTTASYDQNGNLIEMRTPHDDGENVTQYVYDQVGNLTETITPRGVATSAKGDYTHKTIYDELDRVKEVIYPRDPNSQDPREREEQKLSYEYDPLSRITDIIAPASEGQALRNQTKLTYFDNGWIKETTDPHQIKTRYQYNDLGQTTQRTLLGEDGTKTREMTWDYFPDGKVKKEVDIGENRDIVVVESTDSKVEVDGIWNKSGVCTWDVSSFQDGTTNDDAEIYLTSTDPVRQSSVTFYQKEGGEWKEIGEDPAFVEKSRVVPARGEVKAVIKGPARGQVTYEMHEYDPDNPDEYIGKCTVDTSLRNVAGDGNQSFTWNVTPPQDGEYDVYAQYVSGSDRATDAPYTIHFEGGTDVKKVNQQESGSQWVWLGTYPFRAGSGGKVTLTDRANGTVSADSVRLVRRGEKEARFVDEDEDEGEAVDATTQLEKLTTTCTWKDAGAYADGPKEDPVHMAELYLKKDQADGKESHAVFYRGDKGKWTKLGEDTFTEQSAIVSFPETGELKVEITQPVGGESTFHLQEYDPDDNGENPDEYVGVCYADTKEPEQKWTFSDEITSVWIVDDADAFKDGTNGQAEFFLKKSRYDGKKTKAVFYEGRDGNWKKIGEDDGFTLKSSSVNYTPGGKLKIVVTQPLGGVSSLNLYEDDTEGLEDVHVASHALPTVLGDGFRWKGRGTGEGTFTWKLKTEESGEYTVYAHAAGGPTSATNAPYTIHHADGKTEKRVNQQAYAGEWVKLGTYRFDAGTSYPLVLSDEANGKVSADGIKMVWAGPTGAVIDNTDDAHVKAEGDWTERDDVTTECTWDGIDAYHDGTAPPLKAELYLEKDQADGQSTSVTFYDRSGDEWKKIGEDPDFLEKSAVASSEGKEAKAEITHAVDSTSTYHLMEYDPDDPVENEDEHIGSCDAQRPEGENYAQVEKGDGSSTFTWNLDLKQNGAYAIYVKGLKHSAYATDAPYTIHHESGTDTVNVNQRERGDEWTLLGTYPFQKGENPRVVLSNKANGTVVADSLKIVKAEPRELVFDNAEASANAGGSGWTTSSNVPGYYGKDYLWNEEGSGADTITWNLDIPKTMEYTVYARYLSYKDRASDAPYTIYHADGKKTVDVNQQERGSEWVELGTYSFDKGSGQKVVLTDKADGVVIADSIKLVEKAPMKTDKKTFTYDYDLNGNLTELESQTPEAAEAYRIDYNDLGQVEALQKVVGDQVQQTVGYAYDVNGNLTKRAYGGTTQTYTYTERNMLQAIQEQGNESADPRTWSYAYTKRGQVKQTNEPNGNVTRFEHYADGLLKAKTTTKGDGTVLNQHELTYNENGHRIEEALQLLDADGNKVESNTKYEYDPRDRVTSMVKTGDNPLTESVVLDANSNIVSHTQDGKTKTYTYDRNRMMTQTAEGKTQQYDYDTTGRLHTVTQGKQVEESYAYDGFDRLKEHTKLQEDGTLNTSQYTYDAFDRTMSKTGNAGTAEETTTDFHYLGLSEEILSEEVAGKITRSYTYAPWGQRLSMTHHEKGETSYYGTNTRGDVEMLYDEKGNVRGTYGYTMYGEDQQSAFTGVDQPGNALYNPYRYTQKRWDADTNSYDQGFRNYNPSLGRFHTRDMYSDAAQDMGLAMGLATNSRYAFAGGNPVSYSELDGHIPVKEDTRTAMKDIQDAGFDYSPSKGLTPKPNPKPRTKPKPKPSPSTSSKSSKPCYQSKTNYGCGSTKPNAADKVIIGMGTQFADGVTGLWACGSDVAGCYSSTADFYKLAWNDPTAAVSQTWNGSGIVEDWRDGNYGGSIGRTITSALPLVAARKALKTPEMCFVAGTLILTSDGEKPIEEIEVGDKVLSKNEKTGEMEYKEVTQLFQREVDEIYEVHVDGEMIETTDEHPFWVKGQGWMSAQDLQTGDELETSEGDFLSVEKVIRKKQENPVKVYNFEVADFHTYFVSDLHVFVHNKCVVGDKDAFVPEEHWEKKAEHFGTPGTQYDHYRYYKGKWEESRVIYDFAGRQQYRVDLADHSMPESHSIPHLHEYKYDDPGYGIKGKEFVYNFWE
ncbi:DNRLRE domain-containing protein [Mechercharimyces sp. CAU 1602]|uniref:golvesin C-terminal-like domain-containing protein n=1 Tax=Mechercharimyces sp. CAU 1602 TaxID=2973933 RepID=UPI0021618B08|nr:DNRLRE domain-containing protein [Mechercharimyces sp. CAU 1602]MCS1350866.1 DNRLRE domain-containing protein [Mechercharimyces sp. CAU 1602]